MNEGDVVLTSVPQADGTIKNRPAILLREFPPYRDFLVCGISTQLHQKVEGFDEIILRADADFESSGLKAESLIRLSFLAVLPRTKIAGSIGAISRERHRNLVERLANFLIAGVRDE
jgi:mRNA interferase MazF